jgi:two-component system phosphate regulon sensor histidine kinase PhoR
LLGWFYGYPLEAAVLVLLCVVAFWLFQMHRVQLWLQNPQQPPPDIYGIWGELIARIYSNQRKNRVIQEQLQSSVEYLQDSLASMRDGVVMVDAHGAIKWMNAAVEPLLGLRYPEDTGQTLTNLVRAPEFNSYFLAGEYAAPLEYAAIGDSRIHLRVEITYFGQGERLLFIRDVSAAVRMEEIRRDFVANVSHELRTPLTVISGYLSTFIANADKLPNAYGKPLQQMSQQADRMENLIKDLLWLSRIESEKREAKHDRVNVRGLLQELCDELADTHTEHTIELQLECDCMILGDYRELYSAVYNLASNAIKYSESHIPIEISWTRRGDKCALQVRDSGIGIDPLLIPRLTERFYRVDDSRNSSTGGTGLGLAIVKHVAQAHGAQLQIHSQLGAGSSFTLVFPVGE